MNLHRGCVVASGTGLDAIRGATRSRQSVTGGSVSDGGLGCVMVTQVVIKARSEAGSLAKNLFLTQEDRMMD